MTEAELLTLLAKVLELDEVTLDTPLEWDSMAIVGFMGAVVARVGKAPDPDKLFAAKTAGDVVRVVVQ